MNDVLNRLERLVERDRDHDCEGFGAQRICVRVVAVAQLPTRFGDFHVVSFWNNRDEKEHLAIVRGDVVGAADVDTRLHSECLTGDALGSLRCDCRDQLTHALERIAPLGRGLLLYLRQEGRGIGLVNKLKAYNLQQNDGLDTVEANKRLGFKDDLRDYGIGAQILVDLGVRKMRILTNNPKKMIGLEGYGLSIVEQIPIEVKPNEYNRCYLECKKLKMGHLLHTTEAEKTTLSSDS